MHVACNIIERIRIKIVNEALVSVSAKNFVLAHINALFTMC